MVKYIYPLLEIKQSDVAFVGGKAANLGDLARGLTVPEGFCLSCEAYYENLEHNDINEAILRKISGLDNYDMTALDRASEEILELIVNTPVLPCIEKAVTEALRRLGEGKTDLRVAVRSSATAEDLPGASFAGQQETFLDVSGTDNILTAIKKCWASLWTSRAIHYRTNKGFEHDKVRMAVIIQEMIPAAVSGVMFTANPINNSREEIRIEAVRGLGEQLVSGHMAGDVYIFRKDDVNVHLVSKEVSDLEKGPMINEYDLRELAHIGIKIEKYYEDFQDVEWAYYRGKYYFLQTRPITTLADEELPDISLDRMNRFQREVMEWVAERFPEPIYPIDGIVVKVLFMAQFEAMKSFGFAIKDMNWTRLDKGIFPEFFMPPPIRPGIRRIWPYLRLSRILGSDPAREWSEEQVYLLDMLERLKGRDISTLPFELINDYITEAFNQFHFFIVMRYKFFAQNKITSSILSKILRFFFKEDSAQIYENLLAGSENITLVINRALHALASEAVVRPEVYNLIVRSPLEEIMKALPGVEGGTEFLNRFNAFLALYGERETSMGLGGIASPTWQDTPEVVLGLIRGMVNEAPNAEEVRDKARFARMKEAEEIVNHRLSTGLASMLPLKPFVNKVIKHVRSFNDFRENSHYDVTRGLHVFRILFTELGNRFVRRKILNKPANIFYLSYFEVQDIVTTIYHGLEDVNTKALAIKIESRKAQQERRLERWRMRKTVLDESGAIRGIPASQGITKGLVKVIKGPQDFHLLCKGDILVAPYTNPAWTPLFTTASALIVETGGAASHAAIIAREYGIPAVLGVAKATELLRDGESVTVNGNTGVIYRCR